VHSPTLSSTTQLDAYRPLFLPTILIGDAKLGGISTTIAAYESLMLRGYIVDAVLLFREDYYRNWEYLQEWFGKRGLRVESVLLPPERVVNDDGKDKEEMDRYYDRIVQKEGEIAGIVETLDHMHRERIQELDSMPQRTLDSVWWPFVQHGLIKN
jgi:bifunctional dethiobiotin synthetase / adenosylmethionine---8-amino-7-oxononanoate aminotransferase